AGTDPGPGRDRARRPRGAARRARPGRGLDAAAVARLAGARAPARGAAGAARAAAVAAAADPRLDTGAAATPALPRLSACSGSARHADAARARLTRHRRGQPEEPRHDPVPQPAAVAAAGPGRRPGGAAAAGPGPRLRAGALARLRLHHHGPGRGRAAVRRRVRGVAAVDTAVAAVPRLGPAPRRARPGPDLRGLRSAVPGPLGACGE